MSRPAGYSSEEDSDFENFGFDYDKPRKNYFAPKKTATPEEALVDGISDGDVQAVQKALDDGADVHVNTKYSGGYSPIMVAANYAHPEIMEILIKHGANVNDSFEMFNVIMCVCNSVSRDEELLLKCLNLLLENKADPLARDWVGSSALHLAVRRDRQILAQKLIDCGCLVNLADGDGWTPMFHAAQNKNISMVKLLIEAGADIAVMDRMGNSLTDAVASSDDKELIDLLTPKHLQDVEDSYSDDRQQPMKSVFKSVLSTGPKIDDRMSGLPRETEEFLTGIGMNQVASLVRKQNLQFAQLLTWKEEDWKKVGVKMDFYLKKLNASVRQFHEQPWGKGAFPNASKVVIDGEVHIFNVVQFLLGCLSIAHINSISSLYMLTNYDGKMSPEMRGEINKILKTVSVIEKQLAILKLQCAQIDEAHNLRPPDLITRPQPPKKRFTNLRKVVLFAASVAIVVKFGVFRSVRRIV